MMDSDHITGIILAGGKSARMGEDKALKLHQNKPFISYIIESLEHFTSKIIIVSDHKSHEQFAYPRISDCIPNKGPLGGIYSGLLQSSTEKNIILSCDIPFVIPKVIQGLLNEYQKSFDAIVYRSNPLIGIYNRSIISKIKLPLLSGELSIRKNLVALHTKYIQSDPEHMKYLQNINTPEHYKNATI